MISIIIPLFCESSNLQTLLTEIEKNVKITGQEFEIIFIDDGSIDDTWESIKMAKANYKYIKAIRFSRNFGKENAICAGLGYSSGKAAIIMDGDLQHPPALIPKMIEKWQTKKVDIVECIKVNRGKESILNKIGSLIFYFFLDKLTGYNLSNASDFKLLDEKVIKTFLQFEEKNVFFRGVIAWIGFEKEQITFEVPLRLSGHSKWSFWKLMKLAITAVTSFSSIPLQIVTIMGTIFFLFSLILSIQTLLNKI